MGAHSEVTIEVRADISKAVAALDELSRHRAFKGASRFVGAFDAFLLGCATTIMALLVSGAIR